ncbi:alpha-N-acetylgalactosaminidase-like [Babylonia areolata]|uniref:alpha-N-acetylgalactosaminidase-like n=1 Tax=Babylonia areolata TaxID=304850 RepID=UPI003FD5DDDE
MNSMETVLVVAVLLGLSSALDNGLARTPPMGWLSWERFRCVTDCKTYPDSCINEKLYMDMADMVVKLGLRELGYVYIDIDDCWPAKYRDSEGKLVPDPERFPSGMKALADYMHDRGLKLGIYEDFGYETCAKYPGSEFYMQTDANTFAEWEVDMLKFDGCNSDASDMKYGELSIMQKFLNMTGRPILYSCEWPLYEYAHHLKVSDYQHIKNTCNIWRNFQDMEDIWDKVVQIIDYYGADSGSFSQVAGPGGFNDPDMLVVGDFGLSYYQQKAQFGMWAMFASPLFMSVDLRTITQEALDILKNKNVIAINQDPLGAQAVRLYEIPNSISVWMKPLSQNNTAIAFLNKDVQGRPTPLTVMLADLGLNNPSGYNITDVFEDRAMGVFKPSSPLQVLVDPTSILLIKIVPLVKSFGVGGDC